MYINDQNYGQYEIYLSPTISAYGAKYLLWKIHLNRKTYDLWTHHRNKTAPPIQHFYLRVIHPFPAHTLKRRARSYFSHICGDMC